MSLQQLTAWLLCGLLSTALSLSLLPLFPCDIRDCSSSRADLLRYAELPGMPESQARRLRTYADSPEHCGHCFQGKVSLAHRAFRFWNEFGYGVRCS